MKRTVFLPKSVEDRLNGLAELNEEIAGVLLYVQSGNICQIDELSLLGSGTESHITTDPERMRLINKFLETNRKYKPLEFHTHSRGTLKEFGQHYARNFSEGDNYLIKSMLKTNPEYMAMLVTPETKILTGMDNPELQVIDEHPRFGDRRRAVNKALDTIAGSLGIQRNGFRLTITKVQKQ